MYKSSQSTGSATTMRLSVRLLDSLPFGNLRVNRPGDVVYVVGENLCGQSALSELLRASGFELIGFGSGREYLEYSRTDEARRNRSEGSSCLILDLQLPDMGGLDLQSQLAGEAISPVVFVTGHCDIPATVRAMKAGAIDVFTRPVELNALIEAIETAFDRDRILRHQKAELTKLQERFCLLTPREKEVLPLIAGGFLNKQAASVLGVTEVTLQVHRGQIMRKMQAESFAELVRMAVTLGMPYLRGA